MGKKRQYKDDYTGDVQSIQKRHQKFKVLMAALCITGVVAAGSATYVLMNPAQTMTKEGIDEMDPNEDFVVTDEDTVFEDAIPAQEPVQDEENYDNVPLIEEWTDESNAPADAFPAEEPEASLPGAAPQAGAIASDIEETETEPQIAEDAPALAGAAAAAVTESAAEEAVQESEAAPEIVGVSETEAAETIEMDAPAVETEAPAAAEAEAPETEAVSVEAAQTEAAAAGTEKAAAETEAVEAEPAQTEAAEAETEAVESAETEEAQSESATEPAESETQAAEIREKSKDEVYVETEGELLDEKWINSVGLEIRTEDGWNKAETADSGAIEVDADQTLRFRVTYTVEPGTLSPEMRTLIYQIPKEITKVDESYGEIVDAADHVLANYAIDEEGIIRVTFMEDVAQMNADGTKVTCKIEFRTKASNLAQ